MEVNIKKCMRVRMCAHGSMTLLSENETAILTLSSFITSERYGTSHPSTSSQTPLGCTGENAVFALAYTQMGSGCLNPPTDIRMGVMV
jgi:hypothetical protein